MGLSWQSPIESTEGRAPATLQRCPKAMEVVTALVGTVDDLGWSALGESRLQGIQDQLGAQADGHRPADDPRANRTGADT